jgi:hypothetical protein
MQEIQEESVSCKTERIIVILRVNRSKSQHYTDLDTGRQYWSVSEVLTVLDPHAFDGVDPFVLALAQDRGTNLHILFATLVASTAGLCQPPSKPSGVLAGYYAAIELFVRERRPAPILLETPSRNDQLGIAGTVDFNGYLDGNRREEWIIDLKSGPERAVHSSQLHCYKKLAAYQKAKRLGSLYIRANGTYKLVEHTHDAVDWAAASAAIAILNWRSMKGMR